MSSLPLSPRNNACASSPVRLVSTRPRIAQPLLVALALGASLGSVPAAHAANCVDNVPITTVGAGSCTIPAGVTSINVIAVGGGGGGGAGGSLGPPGITVYATALNPGVPRDNGGNGGNGGNGSLTIQWTYTVTATPNPAAGGGRLVCTSITSPNVSGAAQISVGTSGTETVTCRIKGVRVS